MSSPSNPMTNPTQKDALVAAQFEIMFRYIPPGVFNSMGAVAQSCVRTLVAALSTAEETRGPYAPDCISPACPHYRGKPTPPEAGK